MSNVYFSVDGILLGEARNSIVLNYVPSPSGSVSTALNSVSSVVWAATYWPYGEVSSSSGSSGGPFKFKGEVGYYSAEDGLAYLRGRWLSTAYGRFLTEAQVDRRLAGEHAYGYALDNPLTFLDPFGAWPEEYLYCQVPQNLNQWAWGMEQELRKVPNNIIKRTPGLRELDCYKRKVPPLMAQSAVMGKFKGSDRINALGHCMTACLIARHAPECVEYWRTRELGALFGHRPSMMDDWNNEIGFLLGKYKGSCEKLCCMNENLLSWYEPKPHNFPPKPGGTGKIKPNKECSKILKGKKT